MSIDIPAGLNREAITTFLLSLADDELMLGHRNSEWTGHAPILEEDIAWSNISQDELGHSLVWYTIYEHITGRSPDEMAFARTWDAFTCCRFVTYPRGDFAYTVVRQYLFDEAEQVRLGALEKSTFEPLKTAAAKLIREEAYHLLHSKGLVERLGDATEESRRRMQAAVDAAFPQALGLFEKVQGEEALVATDVFPGNNVLQDEWLMRTVPTLESVSLDVPVQSKNGNFAVMCVPDLGGRTQSHTQHLHSLVDDLQRVYRIAPTAKW